ncbi:hypothetical protein ACMXYO_10115 [Neptuniibacter sp. QD37_6]|jgi:hypothetical protein|uniref:hypothetical protein n=1 Tax=Neptuniibacter sp. QD37_6 TaxID=3398210 RepID=UPI0039F63053
MNITQAKETLTTIGYPVTGNDWEDIIEELHKDYGTQVVGSSMNILGDAAPLYMKAGNAAFMVDNKDDLYRACIRIKTILDARKAAEPVIIKSDVLSRYIPEIKRSVEMEVDQAAKFKRALTTVDNEYSVKYDKASRTQTRKGSQIIDDLLSDSKKLNDKAVKALKELLVIERHESVTQ